MDVTPKYRFVQRGVLAIGQVGGGLRGEVEATGIKPVGGRTWPLRRTLPAIERVL
jgi:hypothetical protein